MHYCILLCIIVQQAPASLVHTSFTRKSGLSKRVCRRRSCSKWGSVCNLAGAMVVPGHSPQCWGVFCSPLARPIVRQGASSCEIPWSVEIGSVPAPRVRMHAPPAPLFPQRNWHAPATIAAATSVCLVGVIVVAQCRDSCGALGSRNGTFGGIYSEQKYAHLPIASARSGQNCKFLNFFGDRK